MSGRVRLAPSLYMSIWHVQVQTRMMDFLEVSPQLLDPSECRLVTYGGFLRDD